MSKKPYDLSKIENELKGASSFFKSSTPPVPTPDPAPPATEGSRDKAPTHSPTDDSRQNTTVASSPPETPSRTPVRSVRPVRPVRRQMIRHPFELYQDQVESLRQLAADDRLRGGAGSMSAMVREAIDRLINEQSKSPD